MTKFDKERTIMTSTTTSVGKSPRESSGASPKRNFGALRLDRYSGLYIVVMLVLIFSLWSPDRFGTIDNARVIAGSTAITGIVTLAVVMSLAAGVFDLSLAANMTFSICLLGKLIVSVGLPWPLAVLVTLLAGAVIGVMNAFIIIRMRVDAVIATLGMSSVLAALSFWVSGGKTILLGDANPQFAELGSLTIATIPASVFYLAIVAVVLWFLLEHTPFGRYLYAIGSNAQATKLAGIRVERLQLITLMGTGAFASLAGVVLTMQLSAASYGAGAAYLLPAFAGAFLGSTQVLPGRFNVRGTIVALLLLAVAVKGLQLQFPDLPWIKDLVEGLVVIVAVAITARTLLRRRSA